MLSDESRAGLDGAGAEKLALDGRAAISFLASCGGCERHTFTLSALVVKQLATRLSTLEDRCCIDVASTVHKVWCPHATLLAQQALF